MANTGQTLLDTMEALSPELQLQTGETDVTKGLLILNLAVDFFESICATYPQIFGSDTTTVTPTANTETTAYPTGGWLRIDGIDFLDPSNSLPLYSLQNTRTRGGHRYGRPWWWTYVAGGGATQGRPILYWTNGTNIFWEPIPNASTYTMRVYGFKQTADLTASSTWPYPDPAMLPVATVATKILRAGLDAPITDMESIAKQSFTPYFDMVSKFNRDGAHAYRYDYKHDT